METHLQMADRHIAEGEARCARQLRLIERMAGRGQDTESAEQLLRNMYDTLFQMRVHRDAIVQRAEREKAAGA